MVQCYLSGLTSVIITCLNTLFCAECGSSGHSTPSAAGTDNTGRHSSLYAGETHFHMAIDFFKEQECYSCRKKTGMALAGFTRI